MRFSWREPECGLMAQLLLKFVGLMAIYFASTNAMEQAVRIHLLVIWCSENMKHKLIA